MVQKQTPSFEFRNAIAPRYIEPLLLNIRYGQWYTRAQLVTLLRSQDLDLDGNNIVSDNTTAWSLAGLGQLKKRSVDQTTRIMFRLTELGKQLIELYSTNSELFYDVMHFLFYSVYLRSNNVGKVRFWLYLNVCEKLWQAAPAAIDNSVLTNQLQIEGHKAFPDHEPSFSERSVRGVFPWLQVLTPPFLSKANKSQLYSNRRKYCSAQLFHLASDLVYATKEGLQYGTSLSVTERQIEDICKICLLDTACFWEMADLTRMSVSGFEIRKGQWGTSIALECPPTWVTLPDFSAGKL